METTQTIWLPEPEDHDFPAAQDYLELIYTTPRVTELVSNLRTAKTIFKKAKDILRASGLPLLPKDNFHVIKNTLKITAGKKLSPILLVVGIEKVHIADGYHRLCSAYYKSEDEEVPCRLV